MPSVADQQLLDLVRRRVATLTPDMQRAYLRTIKILRESIDAETLRQKIEAGQIQNLLDNRVIERAFIPYQKAIADAVQSSFYLAVKDLPNAGRVAGSLGVIYDPTVSRVANAVRTLQTEALDTLEQSVQGALRIAVEQGIADGLNSRVIAVGLRDVVGLSETQQGYVNNFAKQLRNGDLAAFDRVLLDKRTAESLKQLVADGKPIPEARIEKAVAAYRNRWIAHNTAINTRQLALDAYRTGNHEAYASAIERGIVDGSRAVKTWVHSVQSKEPRPDHLAHDGDTVPFDGVFWDGSQVAGIGYYGCRCTTRYGLGRRNA